jgi:SAM-dependent methyltransferase
MIELLRESAPLAREAAPRTCYRDPRSGESCAWNHGLWQYLRILGLITTPDDQGAFYDAAFGAAAAKVAAQVAADAPSRAPRVLVSGAADYGMLAEVLPAFRRRGIEPEITVSDLCETPLMLNRWYAERQGARIATVRSDAIDFRDERPYDVICTHSFLGQFTPERRPKLIGNWRRLLRPGGVVVTVNRIRPPTDDTSQRFSGGHAERFRDLVLRAAKDAGGLGLEPDALARDAETYASHSGWHPVRSQEEVTALFERGGLRLERFELAPVKRDSGRDLRGPTLPGGAQYASLVAVRD